AIIECVIGITLLTGKFLKLGLVVMAGAMGGIMAPLVIFFSDLFPGGLPTLEGQYVLKDIILVAAATVVAAHALGARMVPMRHGSRCASGSSGHPRGRAAEPRISRPAAACRAPPSPAPRGVGAGRLGRAAPPRRWSPPPRT